MDRRSFRSLGEVIDFSLCYTNPLLQHPQAIREYRTCRDYRDYGTNGSGLVSCTGCD
jgi:hypothetical protein